MVAATLERLIRRQHLNRQEAEALLRHILAGEVSESQIAALLTGFAVKGETIEELTGFAAAMRAAATPIDVPASARPFIDTCGTGGDGSGTFNISTAAAFVAAGAGARVAKHGNRSISSRCGSADVLEALGVHLELPPARLGACLAEIGIVFLHAPLLHPAMRHVQPARRSLSVRTAFNLLGPLTNPAGAQAQLVGVFAAHWVEPVAEVLLRMGATRAWVVHGEDGLDEISTCAPTLVAEVAAGAVRTFTFDARDLGIARAQPGDLVGGGRDENAAAVLAVLEGAPGPRRDVVLVNAAAALHVGGHGDLAACLRAAAHALDSGAALARLRRLAAFTQAERVSVPA